MGIARRERLAPTRGRDSLIRIDREPAADAANIFGGDDNAPASRRVGTLYKEVQDWYLRPDGSWPRRHSHRVGQ